MSKVINGRSKGAGGEREAAQWLHDNIGIRPKPERNLEQVRHGGNDLIGTWPLSVEVKRCEKLDLTKWWFQVLAATSQHEIPVVMFRKNKGDWEFLLPGTLIGIPRGYIRIDSMEFKLWSKTLTNTSWL